MVRESAGLAKDRPRAPTTMQSCISSIQLRRCPSLCCNIGRCTRSTSGAHTKLTAYKIVTEPIKLIVARGRSMSFIHPDNAELINTQGNPDEHPKTKIAHSRRSAYVAIARRHEKSAVVKTTLQRKQSQHLNKAGAAVKVEAVISRANADKFSTCLRRMTH